MVGVIVIVLLTRSGLCRGSSKGGRLGNGQEGSERFQGIQNIIPQKSTTFRCSATKFAGFYRMSAGDPTGN